MLILVPDLAATWNFAVRLPLRPDGRQRRRSLHHNAELFSSRGCLLRHQVTAAAVGIPGCNHETGRPQKARYDQVLEMRRQHWGLKVWLRNWGLESQLLAVAEWGGHSGNWEVEGLAMAVGQGGLGLLGGAINTGRSRLGMGESSIAVVRGKTLCCHVAGRLPIKATKGGQVTCVDLKPLVVVARWPWDKGRHDCLLRRLVGTF